MSEILETKPIEGEGRGRKYHKFVSIQKREDGTDLEIVVNMPINDYFNDGSGVFYYINHCGMVPYDQYMAEKHQREVEAKRAADEKAAAERIAELEAKAAALEAKVSKKSGDK